MSNPFPTTPIPSAAFHGRARELPWLVQRAKGPGAARVTVASDARLGLSSLLGKLLATLEAQGDPTIVVSALDLAELPAGAGPSELWGRALAPAVAGRPELAGLAPGAALAALAAAGQRLVLLVNHLDALGSRTSLLDAETVALLAEDGADNLAVIGGVGLDPIDLDATLAGHLGGRRWLAAWRPLALDGWGALDVRTLLNRAGTLFDAADHAFLTNLAGGHPLLLHLTAGLLWEARIDVAPRGVVDVRSRADVRLAAAEAMRAAALPVVGNLLGRLLPPDRAALLYLAMNEAGLHVAAPVPRPRATRGDASALLIPSLAELAEGLGHEDLRRVATQVGGPSWAGSLPWGEPDRLYGTFATAIVRADLARALLEASWGLWPERRRQIRGLAALCGIPLRADPVRPPDHAALLRRGLLANPSPLQWTLRAGLVRWWMADELARIANGEIGLARWLAEQDIEDLWTPAALAAADEEIALQAQRLRRGAALLALGAARSPKVAR